MERQERIQAMEWETLEDSLAPSSRGAKVAASEQALRDYFGDEEYEKLRELAKQSRAVRNKRAIGKVAPLGNIILIPGVMGSNLARLENGDSDTIWIHYLRIIAGQISRLRLAADGKTPTVAGLKIVPTDIDKRTYARAGDQAPRALERRAIRLRLAQGP